MSVKFAQENKILLWNEYLKNEWMTELNWMNEEIVNISRMLSMSGLPQAQKCIFLPVKFQRSTEFGVKWAKMMRPIRRPKLMA